MGWGQPGVGPGGVVHYAYAGRGANIFDVGDIYYTQSLDNGTTWSEPIILNSDQTAGGNLAQWMPSLSVTASGTVRVSWFDRRNSTDGWNYEVWGIESADNGQTWSADFPISDTLIPQPEQPDSTVQSCYAGDYNYVTAFGETSYVTWTDGRVPIQGHFQQDVFFSSIPQTPFPGNVSKVR
jgi:Neuraminidase (sialidase)